jgi:PhzF family phenazine biosynthesis protein
MEILRLPRDTFFVIVCLLLLFNSIIIFTIFLLKTLEGEKMNLFQVDAFTNRPFCGNPAGVCLLDTPREAEWMQNIAAEMNLPETAFLSHQGDGYLLRWFTPKAEVDLCGHATLASAHILWETGKLDSRVPARFHTKSGLLIAVKDGEWIEMDFPADPEQPAARPAKLEEALGTPVKNVAKGKFDLLVEVEHADTVRTLTPDLRLLSTLETDRGIIVTASSPYEEADFISRAFYPKFGIDEDPVTGSAHCLLGPYWERRLGKSELLGYQASKRGGTVRIKVENERIKLSGQAVTIFHGELQF